MKVQVLLSCMHQKDYSIVTRTNIQTDAVIINQCNRDNVHTFNFINKSHNNCKIIFIDTTERGLSKSRNMALRHASGDICLICDDDEILFDNYEDIILSAFNNTGIDFATLIINKPRKKYPTYSFNINKINALSMSSYQISFKLNSIISNKITFNQNFGSGVSKAGGEENLFLFSCINAGLKGKYYPIPFGDMFDSESQWWKGYNSEYFYDHAKLSKALWGSLIGFCYIIYTLISKYNLYKKDISLFKAIKFYFKGYFSKNVIN